MAKLYDVYEHPKEKIKREKAERYKNGKKGRRFLTPLEMAIISQDIKNDNGRKKRGEMKSYGNDYLCVCGCGCRGCVVPGSYKGEENPAGIELLKRIMTKNKPSTKRNVDERNELAIKAAGFDTITSFRR
jgi:hypothetical protein